MPTYELNLMIRAVMKPELVTILKRTAEGIFEKSGLIRSIENLGRRAIPYTTSAHGVAHKEAHYYIIKFDSNTDTVADLREEYGRDVDIIRRSFFRVEEKLPLACTIAEEIQPPAYRIDVKKMIEISKNQGNPFTYRFRYNSGMDFYPFNK